MEIIGMLIVFGIPTVWLKPTLNQSESLISEINDTLRTKRQPEFFDFIHQLIDRHANCADQQLSPLKPVGHYKAFETFIYPNGLSQPPLRQQQQHTLIGSSYDPDILAYMSSTKELKPIVSKGNHRILPYNKNLYKDMSKYGSKPYRLSNYDRRKFIPLYRQQQQHINEKNRQIFNKGLKGTSSIAGRENQNYSNPMNVSQNNGERSEKTMANVLTSYPNNITSKLNKQNCTCANLTTPQPNFIRTNESIFNVERNILLLIKQLEIMAKLNNQTETLNKHSRDSNNKDIIEMIEKLKALKSYSENITTKTTTESFMSMEFTTAVAGYDDDDNDLQEIFAKLTTLQPLFSKQELTDNSTEIKKAFNEQTTWKQEFQTPPSINKNFEILNNLHSSDSTKEPAERDTLTESDIVGISGAPALSLNITNSKDLRKITTEVQNLVKELTNRTHSTHNANEDISHSEELNDFDTFAILNALSEGESINENNNTFNFEIFPEESLENTTLPNEILNKTSAAAMHLSDNSSLRNSTINMPFKTNGKFETITVEQQSFNFSNKNIEISEKENQNLAIPNMQPRPIDMTGTGSRFITYLRKPKQKASSPYSRKSYAEPIVSEIYPAKNIKRKSKSPLTIYMHRIEEKPKNSNNNKLIGKLGTFKSRDYVDEEDDDDISSLSKECEDYDDSKSEESQQQNGNLKPNFRELFNYDTNFT